MPTGTVRRPLCAALKQTSGDKLAVPDKDLFLLGGALPTSPVAWAYTGLAVLQLALAVGCLLPGNFLAAGRTTSATGVCVCVRDVLCTHAQRWRLAPGAGVARWRGQGQRTHTYVRACMWARASLPHGGAPPACASHHITPRGYMRPCRPCRQAVCVHPPPPRPPVRTKPLLAASLGARSKHCCLSSHIGLHARDPALRTSFMRSFLHACMKRHERLLAPMRACMHASPPSLAAPCGAARALLWLQLQACWRAPWRRGCCWAQWLLGTCATPPTAAASTRPPSSASTWVRGAQ